MGQSITATYHIVFDNVTEYDEAVLRLEAYQADENNTPATGVSVDSVTRTIDYTISQET